MQNAEHEAAHGLKERAIEEFKVYWVITLYLWLLLGMFTVYRRLVVAETGAVYLHYGIALIEAMVIAKVVLVGSLLGFSRWGEDRALIVPVVYKSLLFGVLVMLFGVVERVVGQWVHKRGVLGGVLDGLHEIALMGVDELAARALTLMVAFVPFFVFWELARVLGTKRLEAMFFSKPSGLAARDDHKT